MIWYNDKISIRQLFALLVVNIFGTGVVLLPRTATSLAASDGWLVVVIATFFAFTCSQIITSLSTKYPKKSFYEYSCIIIGKPIGFLLTIGFVIRLLLHMGLMLRSSLEIITDIMLPSTPMWILSVTLILLSGYGASKGYETRARLAEILIIIILLPISFVFLIAAFNVDYTNLLPMFKTPPMQLVKGGFISMSSFIGIELLLLVVPYVNRAKTFSNKAKDIKRATKRAIISLGISMTIIVIITISRFGIFQMQNLSWPVIQMMDSTALPGSFIERQGVFIMSFFILSVFAVTNACLFFSSLLCRSIVKRGNHSLYIWICMIIAFFISLAPKNMTDVYKYLDMTYLTFGTAYMFFIPLVLLVLSKLKKKDFSSNTENDYLFNRAVSDRTNNLLPFILILVSLSLMTGCDKKELEERAYVTAIAIDKNSDDKIKLTLLKATNSLSDEMKSAQSVANSLPEAISEINMRSNETVYLGITHTIIFGEEILKDSKAFHHSIDSLSRDVDLSKDVYILSTAGQACELIKDLPQGRTSATSPKFDKVNHTVLSQLDQNTLEHVMESLYRTKGTIIPQAIVKDNYLQIEALSLIENYEKKDVLTKEHIQGYLWLLGKGKGSTITAYIDDNEAVASIVSVDRNIQFFDKSPTAEITLDINCVIDGYNMQGIQDDKIEILSKDYSKIVQEKAMLAYKNINDKNDSYLGFWEYMRKTSNELYEKNEKNKILEIDIFVNVEISGTGSLL